MNTDVRLTRIENMLSRALHRTVPKSKAMPARLPEVEVVRIYGRSAARLKQLRLGCHKNGKYQPPRLFNWGHESGRRIDYDVEELERVFKRTIVGTSQVINKIQ